MEMIQEKKSSYILLKYKRKKMEMKSIDNLNKIIECFINKKQNAKKLENSYLKNYFNSQILNV